MATVKICQNMKSKLTDVSRMSSSICNMNNSVVLRSTSCLLSTNFLNRSQTDSLNNQLLCDTKIIALRTSNCEICTSVLNQPHLETINYQRPFLNYRKLFMNQHWPEMCIKIHQVRECGGCVEKSVQPCWKCGKKIDAESEQYFCQCGVIQPPNDRTYFQVMGFPTHFNIDTMSLTKRFRNLQSQLHPDKFTTNTEVEKEYSQMQSSMVNNAYQTLLKPLQRGLYMLKLHNEEIHEEEIHLDGEFLMEIMEINEHLDSVNASDELNSIESENNDKIAGLIQGIEEDFSNKKLFEAKKKLAELQYYCNIEVKIKDKKNDLFS